MAMKSALLGLAGAGALVVASAGLASAGCGGVGNCDTGSVHSTPFHAPDYGPSTVRSGTPYDYMSSIRFQRAPHVSVTRIHGQGPVPGLKDAPHGGVGGCFDHATGYCYANSSKPVSVELFGAPAPAFQAPPVMARPVFAAPALPRKRVVAVGKASPPSAFIPRQYGSTAITPGIVHAPTSIVDRDPGRAQAALDRIAPGSVTPALSGVPIRHGQPYAAPYRLDPVPFAVPADAAPRGVVPGAMPAGIPAVPPGPRSIPIMPAPGFAAPAMPGLPTGLAGAPVAQADGTYASRVGADGTYWEKVSGPTMLGSTVATSVICKRKLPTRTVTPQVGVPFPVPVPVPGPVVDACEGLPGHLHRYEGGRY